MKNRWLLPVTLLLLALFLEVQPVLSAEGTIYTVQRDDTLVGLAARYGLSVSQLAETNGLWWNSWLYEGQRLVIPGNPGVPAPLPQGTTYVVRPGDTLLSIAMHHGVSVSELAAANGLYWNSWVYVGQRLTIPGERVATPQPTPSGTGVYVVRPGNTLFSIARWHGTTVSALKAVNGLAGNTIYAGQRLVIPSESSVPGSPPQTPAPTPAPSVGNGGEKWIDVNLTQQSVTAYEGQTPVHTAPASTGTWRTPTVVGTFTIYAKYASTRMSGPGYDLPNVPYTMYFYRGYAIHGTYWHSNFGTPMSHGCVNLPTPDAEWFYNWAPIGTKVVTHY